MPFFKIWSGPDEGSTRKSLVANTLDDLLKKSVIKLGIEKKSSTRVFLLDGSEIDDDETLQCLDKGTVLIVTDKFKEHPEIAGTTESQNSDSSIVNNDFKTSEKPLDLTVNSASSPFAEINEGAEESKDNYDILTDGIEADKVDITNEEDEYAAKIKETASNDDNISTKKKKSCTSSSGKGKKESSTLKLFCNSAIARGLKVYSEEEISSASSDMEKKYRQFWNQKGNLLCQEPATKDKSKSVLHGIIDVSWTLKKTEILESMANIVTDQEKTLTEHSSVSHGKQLGTMDKNKNLRKNLDRMKFSQAEVHKLDEEMSSLKKKNASNRELSTKKVLLDAAYTELKRAQEALSKSMKNRKRSIEAQMQESSVPDMKKFKQK